MAKCARITVVLTPEDWSLLKQIAVKEVRDPSNQVVMLIREAAAMRGIQPKREEAQP